MIKIIYNTLFLLFLPIITISLYAAAFLVDHSTLYFMMIRVLAMGICFLYFYLLAGYSIYLKRVIEKLNTYPSIQDHARIFVPVCFFVFHVVLVHIGGENLNDNLLAMDNRETKAIIKNCYSSKKTEYCHYEYFVNNTQYKVQYCNCNNLKFKRFDTTTVIYYSKLPVISKLKKEWELSQIK